MAQLSRNTSGQLVADGGHLSGWEQLINKNHLTVWRKPIANSYLYEYKGLCNPQVWKLYKDLQNVWRGISAISVQQIMNYFLSNSL